MPTDTPIRSPPLAAAERSVARTPGFDVHSPATPPRVCLTNANRRGTSRDTSRIDQRAVDARVRCRHEQNEPRLDAGRSLDEPVRSPVSGGSDGACDPRRPRRVGPPLSRDTLARIRLQIRYTNTGYEFSIQILRQRYRSERRVGTSTGASRFSVAVCRLFTRLTPLADSGGSRPERLP